MGKKLGVTGARFCTGDADNLLKLYRIVLSILLLPSILGIAICHTSPRHSLSGPDFHHLETFLPIHQAVHDRAPLSEPTHTESSQIETTALATDHTHGDYHSYEVVASEISRDVITMVTTLTRSTTVGVPLTLRTLVFGDAALLPEVFLPPPKHPPRAS